MISYSSDSGQTWATLSDDNSSSYTWTASLTATNKGRMKVMAYDAVGNNASSISGRFWIAGVPVISSAETVSVNAGSALKYRLIYTVPGTPPGVVVAALSNPSWVTLRNDSLVGTAPDVNRVDTVKVKVSVLDLSDTLVLKVRVIKQITSVLVSSVARCNYFGIKSIDGVWFL